MCISWKIVSGNINSTVELLSGLPFNLSSSKSCELTNCRNVKFFNWLFDKSSFFSRSGNKPYLRLIVLWPSNKIFKELNCENVWNSKLVNWFPVKSISSNFLWNVLSYSFTDFTIIFLNVSLPMFEIWLSDKTTRRRLMAP